MSTEFLISVLSREVPFNGLPQRVTRTLPGIDLAAQQLPAFDAPVHDTAWRSDGLRDFFQYQDLGIEQATAGA